MDITFGVEGLTETWQDDFPEETSCCRCNGIARIGFVAHEEMNMEEEQYLCSLYEYNSNSKDSWLHDACCVAVYFCKDCLEPTALYNQA